jgi:transmembrane sensor
MSSSISPRPPPLRSLPLLGAFLITAAWVSLFVRDTHNMESYETRVGERLALPQQDGSVITLNTNSSMKMRHDGETLYVQIVRGEVHFNMTWNPYRRLVVSIADRVEVIDIATIFDIRLTDDGARITVKEGHVELSVPHMTHLQLHENQQASIAVGPASLAIHARNVSSREVERQLSWLEGYLDFQCETLANAAREFNRYNLSRIEILDEPTRKLQIGGTFASTDAATFADAIAQVRPNVILDSVPTATEGVRILRLRQDPKSRTPQPLGCTGSSHPQQ